VETPLTPRYFSVLEILVR